MDLNVGVYEICVMETALKGAFELLNFLYAEVNFVGMAILLLMMTSWNKSGFKNLPFDQQIFDGLMFLNLLIFLFDTGMWLTDSVTTPTMRAVNYISTTFYYIFNPLICFFWLIYTDLKIYENKSKLMKRMRFYAIPIALSTVISLTSPFNNLYFIIDANNHYTRGPWFPLMAVISIAYLLIACYMPIRDMVQNGWYATKSVNLPLIVFPAAVVAAVLIQIRFFGLSIIWVSTMLACASIYIKIQNIQRSTDYLTGLYNRRWLDQHLRRKIRAWQKKRLLFAIILDLDKFKTINDVYGHSEGDRALVVTSQILRQSCKKGEDFIARLGGDEFIIVGERSHVTEIENLVAELERNTADHNRINSLNYTLSLSMGYAVFKENDTEDSFLLAADQAMYRVKQSRLNRTTVNVPQAHRTT